LIHCEVCGKERYIPKHRVGSARFCGRRCLGIGTATGEKNPFFGKKHTEETKEKCRRGAARQRAEAWVSPSSPEVRVHDELRRRGVVFETEVLLAEKFCVDILVRELNLVIYVDGCYWHACPEHNLTAKKPRTDAARVPYLTKCGFRVVLLWEHDINADVQSLIGEVL